ncbi:hypothetical protein [Acidocella aminolytica]|uniref:hypothetical protein n=1 Tax=Acidocella aminolytica TaxID=33998 RepID=UPI001114FB85|nr:hypothetical protein [Acidocella aminolytica]
MSAEVARLALNGGISPPAAGLAAFTLFLCHSLVCRIFHLGHHVLTRRIAIHRRGGGAPTAHHAFFKTGAFA